MQVPVEAAKEEAVKAVIEEVIAALAPNVIHIRFRFDEDWMGNPAVFFHVLLSDEASQEQNMHRIANQVRAVFDERLDLDVGFPYVRFRSLSEQQASNNPAWA